MSLSILPRPQGLGAFVVLLAALPGAWYGYDFGQRISGAALGVVLAANGAAMCSLLASAAVERVGRLARRQR